MRSFPDAACNKPKPGRVPNATCPRPDYGKSFNDAPPLEAYHRPLQGIYLLSTLVQMRSSFPPPLPSGDDGNAEKNLFSTIPAYEVFGSLFDWSFLIAAGVSAFVRWGASRVNGSGDDD